MGDCIIVSVTVNIEFKGLWQYRTPTLIATQVSRVYHFWIVPPFWHLVQNMAEHCANFKPTGQLKWMLWTDKFCKSGVQDEIRWDILYGPLARYLKLWITHAPGMPGTFSPPPRVSDPDTHHGTCVTHVPWCMSGSLASGFLLSQWRGTRSQHSRRMHNPQFYVSGKRSTAKHPPSTIIRLTPIWTEWQGVLYFNTMACCRPMSLHERV